MKVVDAPLFVPSLDTTKSKSIAEKNKTFSIQLVGELFIPCGLFLEISEKPTKSTPTSTPFLLELTPTAFPNMNETSLSLALTLSNLQQALNSTHAWEGCLLYANEQRTKPIVIKVSLSDERKALAKQAMKWLIPVIAATVAGLLFLLILIVLIRRYRQKRKQKDSLLHNKEELDIIPLDKIEVRDSFDLDPHSSSIVAGANSEGSFDRVNKSDDLPDISNTIGVSMNPSKQGQATHDDSLLAASMAEGLKGEGGAPLIPVNRKDTLYSRLHSATKVPINKMSVAQQIIRALSKLHTTNGEHPIFTHLSSHFVMFDSNGNVTIDLGDKAGTTKIPLITGMPTISAPNPTPSQSNHSTQSKSGEGFELLRWRAPEAAAKDGEPSNTIDHSKAAVFSLGLILFEIETGIVPHGEIDALNAFRQLKTGFLPKLELVHDPDLSQLIIESAEKETGRREDTSCQSSFVHVISSFSLRSASQVEPIHVTLTSPEASQHLDRLLIDSVTLSY
ncbi:hypothetical protein BLNAU_4306 [Blattamonas nauphoetae]|uniref:Protein kinase domain-containing protein n=1 Tax=Blattamonas nauphoetae TaxID=2049346 RepID=A0ABQ9YAE9_9EUKA|nr:hypothetical protein BLNAU_4306 [Blattamonas nauphoetae]